MSGSAGEFQAHKFSAIRASILHGAHGMKLTNRLWWVVILSGFEVWFGVKVSGVRGFRTIERDMQRGRNFKTLNFQPDLTLPKQNFPRLL